MSGSGSQVPPDFSPDDTSEAGVAGTGSNVGPISSGGDPGDRPSTPLEASPPLGSDVSRLRPWFRLAGMSFLGVIVVGGAGLGVLVGPYVLDDWRLDRVVVGVALDWRDFGLDAAEKRLQYDLDHQRIGQQVVDDSCALREDEGLKSVICAWSVAPLIPLSPYAVPMAFSSVARIGAKGELLLGEAPQGGN